MNKFLHNNWLNKIKFKLILKVIFIIILCLLLYPFEKIDYGRYHNSYESEKPISILSPDYMDKDTFGYKSIYGNVINSQVGDRYILVLQVPDFESHSDLMINDIYCDSTIYTKFHNDSTSLHISREQTRKITDSIVRNNEYYKKVFSQKYNYYILDKIIGIKYGPYNYTEYKKMKKKLKIEENFELDFVNTW